jgi:Domain of unknown function (DUF4157)
MRNRELEFRPAVSLRKEPKLADAAPHRPAPASVATQPTDYEAHATLLRRRPAAAWQARRQAVMDLQRSYGNRYTQHVIARALEAPDNEAMLEAPAAEATLHSSIAYARGGGQPLDAWTRMHMEDAFGVDLSGVRTHTGSQAASLSRDLGARAFTTGQDIFFGHGEYDPSSTNGRELLAHELTHVVQQGSGTPLAPGVSDPHDAAELEAAALGRSVAHGDARMADIDAAPSVTSHATAAVQRMTWSERNGLKEADYTSAVYNTKTNTGFYLFTIWHKTDRYYNIQVHWHPATADYPQENWTVRWANEGSGNKPATAWMKNMVRQTSQGLAVAMASQSGGGEEYRAQFPSLTGD